MDQDIQWNTVDDDPITTQTHAATWEWPYYPQYYIPLADVDRDLLIPEGNSQQTGRGVAELHGLKAAEVHRPRAAG